MIRSPDYGDTWASVAQFELELSSLSFVENDVGWSVGGASILRTNDGGVTWSDQSPNIRGVDSPPALAFVRFSDALRGIAVGQTTPTPGNGFVGSPLALFTTDGGSSWRVATIASSGDNPAVQRSGLSEVCLTSAGRAIAEGGAPSGERLTIVSDDYGASWRDITDAAMVGAVSCSDDGTLWGLGGPRGLIRSADGGNSWQDRTLPDVLRAPNLGAPTALVFLSGQEGLVAGVAYQDSLPVVFRTTDSGETWQQEPIAADPGDVLVRLLFGEETTLAVGYNQSTVPPLALAFTAGLGSDQWEGGTILDGRLGEIRDASP